jgi:hypothetical protein
VGLGCVKSGSLEDGNESRGSTDDGVVLCVGQTTDLDFEENVTGNIGVKRLDFRSKARSGVASGGAITA